jgi:hypothetical protein
MGEPSMSVSDAAARIRRSYGQTLRLGQIGQLDLFRDTEGRWRITVRSLERLAAETATAGNGVRRVEPAGTS